MMLQMGCVQLRDLTDRDNLLDPSRPHSRDSYNSWSPSLAEFDSVRQKHMLVAAPSISGRATDDPNLPRYPPLGTPFPVTFLVSTVTIELRLEKIWQAIAQ
jgi:hypothetical protein